MRGRKLHGEQEGGSQKNQEGGRGGVWTGEQEFAISERSEGWAKGRKGKKQRTSLNPEKIFSFQRDSGDACPVGFSLGFAGVGEEDHGRRSDKNVRGGPQKDERRRLSVVSGWQKVTSVGEGGGEQVSGTQVRQGTRCPH